MVESSRTFCAGNGMARSDCAKISTWTNSMTSCRQQQFMRIPRKHIVSRRRLMASLADKWLTVQVEFDLDHVSAGARAGGLWQPPGRTRRPARRNRPITHRSGPAPHHARRPFYGITGTERSFSEVTGTEQVAKNFAPSPESLRGAWH